MIYTSYFANRKIPSNYVKVSIALYNPKKMEVNKYLKLAPTNEILDDYKTLKLDDEDYEIEYVNNVLNKLEVHNVFIDLMKMCKGKNIVLLCYEKPIDFCHRHIVAKWFKENGYRCEELN